MKNAERRMAETAFRNILHFQFCILHSDGVGLLFPANHAPGGNGVMDWWSDGVMGRTRQDGSLIIQHSITPPPQFGAGVPDRLRSGDLLHERQACWLDYTTGTKW